MDLFETSHVCCLEQLFLGATVCFGVVGKLDRATQDGAVDRIYLAEPEMLSSMVIPRADCIMDSTSSGRDMRFFYAQADQA
jgi:hypothetical protein